jgi:predicted transcriptional regulator
MAPRQNLTAASVDDIASSLEPDEAAEITNLFLDYRATLSRLEEAEQMLSTFKESNLNLLARIKDQQVVDDTAREVDDKLNRVNRELAGMELTLLRKDLECEKRVNYSIMELVRTVFKNPVIKESVFESKGSPVTMPGHSYPQTHTWTESKTTVRESE